MLICGIKGTSLIDYPGKVAAVVYTGPCNFRCPFCHNPQLALGQITPVSQESLLTTISARLGFIDGVVITGGEPTLYGDLGNFIATIKNMGLSVKLDTNGSHPEILQKLLADNRLDFIAMDIKTSWSKYQMAAGTNINTELIVKSVELIKKSKVAHEFRTTCVPSLVTTQDIEFISRLVGSSGTFTLQQFQPENTLDVDYSGIKPYSHEELSGLLEIARKNSKSCRLIGI